MAFPFKTGLILYALNIAMLLLSCFSHVRLFATPWTAACQAPPSMGFARQEYWSGVPLPSPKYCYSEVQLNTVVMKRCF